MEKMIAYFWLFLILIIVSGHTFAASTVGNGTEVITFYQINMGLNQDGSADVTEQITYDFGSNQKHGIYRIIPAIYKPRRGNPHQTISNISVKDENGGKYKTEVSGLNTITVKIGDPNTLVTGKKTYIIKYNVKRVINSLGSKDQFIWNFIGDGWNVPIQKAEATVVFPKPFDARLITSNCFVGAYKSGEKCTSTTFSGDEKQIRQIIYTQDSLLAHNGMTIQIDFPENTFPQPTQFEILFWTKPWYLALPAIFLIIFFIIWYRKGRDSKGQGTIIAQYEAPKEVEPVESGYFIGESMSNKHLSAQLVYLAINGYIKIKRIENKGFLDIKVDYELIKVKGISNNQKRYNSTIMNAFFKDNDRIKISELKDTFASDYRAIKSEVYKEVVSGGYYQRSPVVIRILYILLAAFIFALGIGLGFLINLGVLAWISLLMPGIIALSFAIIMPAKTAKGVMIKEYLLGLKEYIRVAESDRIKFHNAPTKNPEKFEELLPYAMVFGLEKEWAKQFADIYKDPPNWYVGNHAAFNVIVFSNDINSFSSSTSSTFTSVSSSGGGGFAGGGGGGGGGGSW
jgi:uncharacterized membrane protein YgcG